MKKNNSAFIGFWLVLGASKKNPLIVCPALVSDKEAPNIDSISIDKAWKVSVQIPFDAKKGSIITMIPEIVKLKLEKKISEYNSLWDIPEIKAKCESLAIKYIEQFKLNNK